MQECLQRLKFKVNCLKLIVKGISFTPANIYLFKVNDKNTKKSVKL